MHLDKSAASFQICALSNKARHAFRAWIRAQDGATAIEYALIATGISVAIAGVVFLLGDDLQALYQRVLDGLNYGD